MNHIPEFPPKRIPKKLPKSQKDYLIKKEKSIKKLSTRGIGVMYIAHIPHGFYEDEMRRYFSQFGVVNKIRISRSGRTNRSRGYGFVEFADEDVAKIVAETMDGYMMFNKILKCRIIPQEKVNEKLFLVHAKRPTTKEIHAELHNSWTFEREVKSTKNRLTRFRQQMKKLRAAGLKNFDYVPEVPDELTDENLAMSRIAREASERADTREKTVKERELAFERERLMREGKTPEEASQELAATAQTPTLLVTKRKRSTRSAVEQTCDETEGEEDINDDDNEVVSKQEKKVQRKSIKKIATSKVDEPEESQTAESESRKRAKPSSARASISGVQKTPHEATPTLKRKRKTMS